ncbi:MAG: hypothetical protein ACI8PT_002151 [Gammaproteobacteria bacterium]|jgi:hypothetical protein
MPDRQPDPYPEASLRPFVEVLCRGPGEPSTSYSKRRRTRSMSIQNFKPHHGHRTRVHAKITLWREDKGAPMNLVRHSTSIISTMASTQAARSENAARGASSHARPKPTLSEPTASHLRATQRFVISVSTRHLSVRTSRRENRQRVRTFEIFNGIYKPPRTKQPVGR